MHRRLPLHECSRSRSPSLRTSSSTAQPAVWTIRHCRQQPPESNFELTHERALPLPLAIELQTEHGTFPCIYAGHGHSKITFAFKADRACKVLKITAMEDQEPFVCITLSERCRLADPALKLCPAIYEVEHCVKEYDASGNLRGEWFAWTAEYTIPLNKYMRWTVQDDSSQENCIRGALFTQVKGAQQGLLPSDNNLNNFGVSNGSVVILDIGSRSLKEPGQISKSELNHTAIIGWWKKLQKQCQNPRHYTHVRQLWQSPGYDLKSIAADLRHAPLPDFEGTNLTAAASSVVQPAYAITEAPHVWWLCEHDMENIEWFTNEYLFKTGMLCNFRLFTTGRVEPLEQCEQQPVDIRLEALFQLTHRKRAPYVERTGDSHYVLSDEEMRMLVHNWQEDYGSWMTQESIDRWNPNTGQRLHNRFRAFLHQMVGCTDFVRFCLYAPLNPHTFRIFCDNFSNHTLSKVQKFDYSIQTVRMVNDPEV